MSVTNERKYPEATTGNANATSKLHDSDDPASVMDHDDAEENGSDDFPCNAIDDFSIAVHYKEDGEWVRFHGDIRPTKLLH